MESASIRPGYKEVNGPTKKGNHTIDNPSSQGANGHPPDYLRLQFGGTTISETSDTIPPTAAGTSHLIGLVAFLVPQEETSFTLVLLPSDLNGATSQATISFQIP